MTAPTTDELFDYVQERCLWQFFSRSWDRAENIEGILGATEEFLTGKTPLSNSPMKKLFYAEGRVLSNDLRRRFPGLAELTPAEIKQIIAGVKERVTELAVTGSRNRELNQKLY